MFVYGASDKDFVMTFFFDILCLAKSTLTSEITNLNEQIVNGSEFLNQRYLLRKSIIVQKLVGNNLLTLVCSPPQDVLSNFDCQFRQCDHINFELGIA